MTGLLLYKTHNRPNFVTPPFFFAIFFSLYASSLAVRLSVGETFLCIVLQLNLFFRVRCRALSLSLLVRLRASEKHGCPKIVRISAFSFFFFCNMFVVRTICVHLGRGIARTNRRGDFFMYCFPNQSFVRVRCRALLIRLRAAQKHGCTSTVACV